MRVAILAAALIGAGLGCQAKDDVSSNQRGMTRASEHPEGHPIGVGNPEKRNDPAVGRPQPANAPGAQDPARTPAPADQKPPNP
jgi:hypothetical protein